MTTPDSPTVDAASAMQAVLHTVRAVADVAQRTATRAALLALADIDPGRVTPDLDEIHAWSDALVDGGDIDPIGDALREADLEPVFGIPTTALAREAVRLWATACLHLNNLTEAGCLAIEHRARALLDETHDTVRKLSGLDEPVRATPDADPIPYTLTQPDPVVANVIDRIAATRTLVLDVLRWGGPATMSVLRTKIAPLADYVELAIVYLIRDDLVSLGTPIAPGAPVLVYLTDKGRAAVGGRTSPAADGPVTP